MTPDFESDELAEALAARADYDASDFEVPEPLHFRDLLAAPEQFLELCKKEEVLPADPLELFPYPKGRDGIRWMAIPSRVDEIRLTALVHRMADVLEPALSTRVHSSRLVPGHSSLFFVPYRRAHRGMRTRIKRRLLKTKGVMARIDIRSYFPSINLRLLEERLLTEGCFGKDVQCVIAVLGFWQENSGITGIPIGPLFSRLLGNYFLRDLDEALTSAGVWWARWVDDVVITGDTPEATRAGVRVAEDCLPGLLLSLGRDKTKFLDSTEEALGDVESGLLTSMFVNLRRDPEMGGESLRDFFWDRVWLESEVSQRDFRAAINSFKNRKDDFAAARLMESLEKMNVDPKTTAEYFGAVCLDDPVLRARFLQVPLRCRTPNLEALSLHLMRVASERSDWTVAEGQVFEEIARDESRHSLTRAWALGAYSHSAAWTPSQAFSLAYESTDPRLQRVAIAGLSGAQEGECLARLRRFRKEYALRGRLDLVPVTMWVEEVWAANDVGS